LRSDDAVPRNIPVSDVNPARIRCRDILLQEILNADGVELASSRQLPRDVHNRGKNITPFVGQQSRGTDVVHLGDLVVQLDKPCRQMFARNLIQSFFDLRAEV
jgi:hypothetical protein